MYLLLVLFNFFFVVVENLGEKWIPGETGKVAAITHLIEQISDLVGVLGVIDVPQRARFLACLLHPLISESATLRFLHCC